MDLISLRAAFRVGSGRYDLDDAGVDAYLNAGQRYLDHRVHGPHEVARNFQMVTSGAVAVTFSAACRVIHEVWVASAAGGRYQLDRWEAAALRAQYNQLPEGMTKGRPLHYMPAVLRTSPERPTVADLKAFVGYMDVLVGQSYGYTGVIFFPPADRDYQVEVVGKFYTPDLGDDVPMTYWSANHDRLLLMAARREMEVDLRNSEGVKDFDLALAVHMDAIERDVAEQEAMDIGVMQG